MDKKNIKKVILLLLIITQTLIVGCSSHDSVQSISMGDVMEAEQKIEDLRVEIVKETMSEKLKKMYGDGLWKEDFSVEKEILDKALEKHFDEICNLTSDVKFFTRSDMEYYNSDLKDLRDGKLTVDEFIIDPSLYIFRGDIYYYYWVMMENAETKRINYKAFESLYLSLMGSNEEINFGAFSLSDLNDISISYDQFRSIESIEKINDIFLNDMIDNGYGFEDLYEYKEIMHKKYNEKFRYKGNRYFYPVDSPDVIFEVKMRYLNEYDYTKYLAALSQKHITAIVKDIIKEEGGEDFIIPFIIPCGGDWNQIDENSYDTSQIETYEDKIKFLNEGFLGNYDVNLYYLKDDETEVDYELIFRAVKRIKSLVTIDGFDKDWGDFRTHTAVYFYNGSDIDKETIKYLFNRDVITENYFIDPSIIKGLRTQYWRDRDNTDGFDYLDAFFKKENYYLNITGKFKDEMTLEELINWSKEEKKKYDY